MSCGKENPAEASFCMSCATPLGEAAPSREVRKTVTALFCDLVGSTTLGERHDPEVLRPILDGYFTEMRSAVERHGGRVEKSIGDAVAAVFGLPTAHEDDALRAVRAGVEMQERLRTLSDGSQIRLAARALRTQGAPAPDRLDDGLHGRTRRLSRACRRHAVVEPRLRQAGRDGRRQPGGAATTERT
jgi:hypothetical protein